MEKNLASPYSQKLEYWKNQKPPEIGQKYTDTLFFPNINSLLSKKENGEFIDIKHGPQMENRIKIDEIIWLRTSEIFKNQKYSLFESKIELSKISQGSLGDCYFVASIASLVQYPNLIYQIFKTKEINKEGYFELIFFIDGKFQIVIVDDYLPVNIKTKKICFTKPNNNEIWICILEKAWAKINGGYSNIIKGWMHQALQAFTGYGSEVFKHKEIKYEKLLFEISEAKKNNFILTCSTNDNVNKFGLVNNHAYSLLDCIDIISKGKNIKLVKLRNVWEVKDWNGDWGNKSQLWGEEEKKQVNFDEKIKEVFYMSFVDYYKYFNLTEICYVLYNSYSKSYLINENNIEKGNVFNIYLEEDGYFSVALIKKMWRFNRELVNSIIPSYLSIVRYNPLNNDIKSYFNGYIGKNDSYEDIYIFRYLRKGYYLIYSYQDLPHSNLTKLPDYIIKFDSSVNFRHKIMPDESSKNGFILLKNILMQIILRNNNEFNDSQSYLSINKSINKDCIAYKIIYNNQNHWINYNEDYSQMKNMFFLSPYLNINDSKVFEWILPPKGINIILSMCINTKLPYNFNLNSKAFILDKNPQYLIEENSKINIKEYANDSVFTDNNITHNYYDYISISLKEAKEDLPLSSINPMDQKNAKTEIEYKKIIEFLENLPKIKNESRLLLSKIDIKNVEYIGQINKYNKREGKGCLIYKNSDHLLIGYFKEGKINGNGYIFNKSLDKKIFEGNFVSGKKKGKGILYFYNGDRYEGEFDNDKRNGKGIYFFNTEKGEQKWEGNFIDGNMNGEGIFTNYEGKQEIVKYYKGRQIIKK